MSSSRSNPQSHNAAGHMAGILGDEAPLTGRATNSGSRVTAPWTRDGFDGEAPGMPGHLIGTYHRGRQPCTWVLENESLSATLEAGTFTLVPEGHDGRWLLAGPIGVSHVYLTQERLQSCAELLGCTGRVDLERRLGCADPIVSRLLEVLSFEAEAVADPESRLFAERALDLLSFQLLRRHSVRTKIHARPPRGLARWQVKRVSDFMRDHLDQEIGLDGLASLVGLSRFYFCTAFRLASGRTPHAYLTSLRMQRASDLLQRSPMRITDVALAVGYATPSAFAATFRRTVGVTPTAFRRAARAR